MSEDMCCDVAIGSVACSVGSSPWAMTSAMQSTWPVIFSWTAESGKPPGQGYEAGHALQPPLGWDSAPFKPQLKRLSVPSSGRADACMEAILPKVKRMRVQRSIGQLRLQREALDAQLSAPGVHLCVEPDQLRATVCFDEVTEAAEAAGCAAVRFQILFPPRYPHRPPAIVQVEPQRLFSFLQYHDRRVELVRVSERYWRPVMGLADVVRDLMEALSVNGVSSREVDLSVCSRLPGTSSQVSHSPDPTEIEMT
eukprot:TRINITY_DN49675_c0_g1_i1.p1 TRINITY_DN49675_c0_g1~~TRINITY_DN49675_c0_g1_i1.p1  ORF type:complete len:253 (+),score=32.61 TRINITY_DN49675_c0_g1_i1:100-858(+)